MIIKNYIVGQADQEDFFYRVAYLNDHIYRKVYYSILNDLQFSHEDQSPLTYLMNNKYAFGYVLFNALRAMPYDYIEFVKESEFDEHPAVADFLSIFGFKTGVRNNDGKMKIVIIDKPEVFDFNEIPVLEFSEWKEIIEMNHSNYVVSKTEKLSEITKDSETSEKVSKEASTFVSYKD